jgi:hypothetical protein
MKIEVEPSRPVLLRTVWGTGYRLETEGAPGHQATAADVAPIPTAS